MEDLQGKRLKGYKLEDRIGNGGFGAVYRARQTTIGREVAVKFILPHYANNPDFIRRFESEAHLIARLEHPHITPLYDFWRDPSGAYLVMRYLRGGSIRDTLENDSFELPAISQLLDQLASALDFAHRNNVIHRDIKPGNILLDEDGNTYLADFGIAKDLTGITDNKTAADAVVGSLDYISPEQARNEPVTPRTDIYSLGVTLYELITGEHPFKNASTVERLYKHISDPLPEIDNLPDNVHDQINEIIQKATAKNPDDRYSDVLALAVSFREGIGLGTQQMSTVEQLTMREQEILSLIVDGMSNREIADKLVVTVGTVKWHIRQLYKKLGIRSRVQAIVRARELNLIANGHTTDDLPAVTGQPISISLPEPENPYKGLHSFQMTDARDFFGRDDLVTKLIDQMTDQDPLHRFVAIVGPSGSGKSSLAKAGLIPALWKGAILGSEKWYVVDMIPGSRPLDKLEIALMRVSANQSQNLRQQLERDDHGLSRVADLILPGDDTELVIVVDQFEEVFTLVEDEATRQQFLDLLRVAVSDVRSRVRVIVTLRADYYDRPLHYPEFGELIRNRMETVLPLSAKGLERAVRGPAERVGMTFEQGLVEQIVSQMNYQAGALPLLQYALTELFDRRSGRILTNEAYQQIGGAVGALANRADEIYRGLTEEAQELAHQMFMRLVTLGEGAEDTRRRVTHVELLSRTDNTDLMEEIIDQFSAYRLLSLDHDPETRQPTVEVAHEAILREWDRLRQWLNESRDDIRQERVVSRATKDWNQHDRDTSYLLRGARLEQIEKWQGVTGLIQTPVEREFITISLQQRETEQQAELARQEREKQLKRRSRDFLRGLVAVFALAAVVAGTLSVIVLNLYNQSQQDSAAFRSIALANDAQQALDNGQPDLALVLAEEAINMDKPPALTQEIYFLAATSTWIRQRYIGHTQRVYGVDYSPDGTMAVTTGWDNTAILWDINTAEILNTFEYLDRLTYPEFHPTDNLVAFGAYDGTAVLWNIDTDTADYLQYGEEWVESIRFSPDGNFLSVAGGDSVVQIWDVDTHQLLQKLEGHDDGFVVYTAWSSDSRRLLTAGQDNTVIMWDAINGEAINSLLPSDLAPNEERFPLKVAFLPDDRRAISVHVGGFIYLWDTETGEILHNFEQQSDDVYGLDISSNGRYLLTSTNQPSSSVSLWEIETGQLIRIYQGHTTRVQVAKFSPDEKYILSASTDGTAILWDLHPPGMIYSVPIPTGGSVLSMHPDGQSFIDSGLDGNIYLRDTDTGNLIRTYDALAGFWQTGLSFSPDGRYMASGDYITSLSYEDQNVHIWDIQTGEIIFTLDEQDGYIWDLAFSDDGEILAVAESLGTRILLWNINTGELIRILEGHSDEVYEVVFSKDRQTLFSASRDRTLREWDIATGDTLRIYEGHTSRVTSLELSSDETQLLSAAEDGSVILWDISTGLPLQTLMIDDSLVYKARFSPDGSFIVTGSRVGNGITLWDTDTGQPLWRTDAHSLASFWVHPEFTPDGRVIVSVGEGGDVIAWDVSAIPTNLEQWIADNRYIPDFTCGQRELYIIEPLCETTEP